jgi:peroxiredoxin Q/BCP
MLEEGAWAPDFTAPAVDASGEEVEIVLSDFVGTPVVLYFYPKDNTSGCTKQACGIRDEWPAFRDTGAVVLGVSPDSVDSHRAFSHEYDLPFTLVADPDHSIAEAYGVWKEKSMYGRKYWGVERTSFLIDVDGRVERVFRRVKPAQHADQVLEALAG